MSGTPWPEESTTPAFSYNWPAPPNSCTVIFIFGYFSLNVFAVSSKALAATFQPQTISSVSVFSSIVGNSTALVSAYLLPPPHEKRNTDNKRTIKTFR